MISSDCVYATVARGKKWRRSAQVDIMAVCMRSSNGRAKCEVKREKPWPSRRRMMGLSRGRAWSNCASYDFMRAASDRDLSVRGAGISTSPWFDMVLVLIS